MGEKGTNYHTDKNIWLHFFPPRSKVELVKKITLKLEAQSIEMKSEGGERERASVCELCVYVYVCNQGKVCVCVCMCASEKAREGGSERERECVWVRAWWCMGE